MESYLFFIIISIFTIATPGQGIIYTISNSSKYGYKASISGIFGIVFGVVLLGILAISSIGALLKLNNELLLIIQIIGAFYLIYIAIRQMYPKKINNTKNNKENKKSLFLTGFLLTILNPKPIVFFSSFFPQFISINNNYIFQMVILMLILSFLVFIIHSIYSLIVVYLGTKIDSIKNSYINKVSSYVLLIVGVVILFKSIISFY